MKTLIPKSWCTEAALKERITDLETQLSAAQQRVAELEKQLTDIEPYLKERETPAECVARNRKDVVQALKMLADETLKREALEQRVEGLQDKWALVYDGHAVFHCLPKGSSVDTYAVSAVLDALDKASKEITPPPSRG